MKPRHIHRAHHVPGTAPGTLAPIADAQKPKITVTAYNHENVEEVEVASPGEVKPFLDKWDVVWINVDGLGDLEVLSAFGEMFNLHLLALEDVLNLSHRPKCESFDDHLFVIARMVRIVDGVLDSEQVSMFVGKKFILTFQEHSGDVFDPVRHRLRNGKGRRIREHGPAYMGYALLDSVVDGYFPVLEWYGERINHLEDVVIAKPDNDFLHHTHDIKRDLRMMRQAIWPMREAVRAYGGEDNELVNDDMRPFLTDCYDHVIQVMDVLESYRDRASGLIDIYLSSLSNRMNEIMKVLTIIATIFIPLGFVAGLYGMNFDTSSPWNMPELGAYYGYPMTLLVMLLIALGLLWYFYRCGWIGAKEPGAVAAPDDDDRS